MSFYIAGKKDTKDVVETGQNSIEMNVSLQYDRFLDALSINHETTTGNISLYHEEQPYSDEANMVMDGGSYTVVWTGDEITGIDISDEEAKRYVKAYATEGTIDADGVDTTTVRIELWKADGSGIDTGVTTTVEVPIDTPAGKRKVKANMVDGVVERVFKTTVSGIWRFPSRVKRYKNVRIAQVAEVEAVLLFADI